MKEKFMEIEERRKEKKSKNCFIFVLIFIIIILLIIMIYQKFTSSQKIIFSQEINKLESLEIEGPVIFKQPTESTPAKNILVHLPKKEIFMSTLHPAAALYKNVTNEDKIKECIEKLYDILQQNNIKLITVRSALKLNHQKLKKLANEMLIYKIDTESEKSGENYDTFKKYLSDEYKKEVINLLTDDQLIDIVLTKPTYILKYVNYNTFIEPSLISYNPVGNLIFCRDQQITTAKGIVIGRSKSSQRSIEHKIMKNVFENLGSNIIGEVTENYNREAYLEGGDFIVAKKDLSMIGVGLRTTISGAFYLMEKDLLNTRYFAIIFDDNDLDQQRMHLDTYFNILNEKNALVLDFDDVYKQTGKKIGRKVYLFDNNSNNINKIYSDSFIIKNEVGKYKLVKIYEDFYIYLKDIGFNIIKASHKQQVDYMINFLNIGNNKIISVNKDLKSLVKGTGIDVIDIEFSPILSMYGGMHCITQVSRVN